MRKLIWGLAIIGVAWLVGAIDIHWRPKTCPISTQSSTTTKP